MLIALKAYRICDQVHNMTYMVDPILDTYGILFIRSLSSLVEGPCVFVRHEPCCIGMNPLLESCILKRLSNLSMYVL